MSTPAVSVASQAAEPAAAVFGTLVESRRERGSRLRLVTLQIAVAAHAVALAALVIDKWLEVPPIPAPSIRAAIATILPPPPPPPPPAPAPAVKPRVEAPMPQELVAPEQTPEQVVTEQIPETPEVDVGAEGGVEGGVAGGVPGGEVAQEPTIYRLGEGATTPELIHRVEPDYPSIARSARVQGTVILKAIIRTDGSVCDIETLRGQPMGLTEAAIAAVSQWRYRPAELDGAAVPFQMTVLIHFKLQN